MITVLFTISILSFSCSKSKDESNTDGDNLLVNTLQLLTNNTWTITGIGDDDNNNGVLENTENQLRNCTNFATATFSTNGISQNTAIPCPSNMEDVFTGNFILSQDKDGKLYLILNENAYSIFITNSDKTIHIKGLPLRSQEPRFIYRIERP